jgi:hypothetical protein
MSRRAASPLVGKWRITEMAIWDGGIPGHGRTPLHSVQGQRAQRVQVRMRYRQTRLHPLCRRGRVHREGRDEMDPVSADDGWAELDHDGAINGEIRFHLGDESTFKAHRW